MNISMSKPSATGFAAAAAAFVSNCEAPIESRALSLSCSVDIDVDVDANVDEATKVCQLRLTTHTLSVATNE